MPRNIQRISRLQTLSVDQSLNKDKRTRLIYLGQKRVARALEYSTNYKRLLAIVEQITMVNMELLRRDADR